MYKEKEEADALLASLSQVHSINRNSIRHLSFHTKHHFVLFKGSRVRGKILYLNCFAVEESKVQNYSKFLVANFHKDFGNF